jgi:uncharacterized protein YndB with AHSA1/START domain
MTDRRTVQSIQIKASKSVVYQTILEKELIHKWKVPDDMICTVHEFNPIENGSYRISLEYENINEIGKTTRNIDTYHGYFKILKPYDLIVEIDEFESDHIDLKGLMSITYTLIESNGETNLEIIHDHLPNSISLSDNLLGWQMALVKLKRLIETQC